MREFFNGILSFIKTNYIISALVGIVFIFLFFPRLFKGLTGKRRVKHRPGWKFAKSNPRAVKKPRRRRAGGTRSGKPMPRSVGTRSSKKGYPKVGGGYIPFKKNKDGSIKKAWQVGGTVAAKSRMSKLRRAR